MAVEQFNATLAEIDRLQRIVAAHERVAPGAVDPSAPEASSAASESREETEAATAAAKQRVARAAR